MFGERILVASETSQMNPLAKLLNLPALQKEALGLLHTPGEIHQQPETWWRTFETVKSLQPKLNIFLNNAGVFDELKSRPSIIVVGAGTSDYVGRSVLSLLQRSWQCEVRAIPSTDLLTSFDDFYIEGKPYLWISFSRSGDSSEGVAVLEMALERYPEIQHIVVCCNREGRLAQVVAENITHVVLNDEVNDRGLAMTSSFSNMVVAAQCLAHVNDLVSYGQVLQTLVAMAQEALPKFAEISQEEVNKGFAKVCFLGTGSLHGVAVESALKVLELTAGRIVSYSESFLGLRHGPLSAIDDDTLLIAYLSHDRKRRSYELDLINEIKGKGLTQKIIAVVPRDAVAEQRALTVRLVQLSDNVADGYRPPVDVILGQLLGLFSSVKLGLQPDSPSPKGAITRVVSKVKIY